MRGQPADCIFTPEDRESGHPEREMRQAQEGGRAFDERWHVRKNGTRFLGVGRDDAAARRGWEQFGFTKIARDRTAAHLDGKALADAEARLRRAQEAGGVGLFTVVSPTACLSRRPSFCRLYGLPERESYRRPHSRTRHPGGCPPRLDGRDPRGREPSARRCLSHSSRRQRRGAWIARKGEIEFDDQGRPVRFSGASRDNTDQRAAQEALQESEDHFRHTVELNPQVPWTCDPQGNITSYSTRWLELTGQAPGEPYGTGWMKVLHPDDVPHTVEVFSRCLASGDPVDVDYRINVAASGNYRWMRARARPRRDVAGGILCWYGVVEDIHDQRLAEAALRASEEQFRAFAQAVPNHVWASRPDGHLYWFNNQIYAYSGAAPGELDGIVEWTKVLHPDDLTASGEAWARSLATGVVYETEFRIRRADGAYRWFLVRAEPVWGADGAILRWVGTNTDIDERRRQAEELSNLKRDP